jgi:hypothetical protein
MTGSPVRDLNQPPPRGHDDWIERVCLSKYLPPQRLLFAGLSWQEQVVFK